MDAIDGGIEMLKNRVKNLVKKVKVKNFKTLYDSQIATCLKGISQPLNRYKLLKFCKTASKTGKLCGVTASLMDTSF